MEHEGKRKKDIGRAYLGLDFIKRKDAKKEGEVRSSEKTIGWGGL